MKTHPTTRLLAAVTLAVASIGLVACGDDGNEAGDGSATDSPATGVASKAVVIKTFAFQIPESVSAGALTITNADDTTHTFTHVPENGDPAFDVSLTGPDASETIDVTPGTYAVRCNIHTSMTGTLTVT